MKESVAGVVEKLQSALNALEANPADLDAYVLAIDAVETSEKYSDFSLIAERRKRIIELLIAIKSLKKNAIDDICEEPYQPLQDEIKLLERMINYYSSHAINDDDLDMLQDIMVRANDDIDMYEWADDYVVLVATYEKALLCLERKHAIFDERTGCIAKTMDEVIDSMRETGDWCRSWSRIGIQKNEEKKLEDIISSEDHTNFYDHIDRHLLSDMLSRIINTLPERERQVVDFRFGLSDGYCMGLEEVGRLFNVTRERVRQIEKKALNNLRRVGRIEYLERISGKTLANHLPAKTNANQYVPPKKYRYKEKEFTIEELAEKKMASIAWIKERLMKGMSIEQIMDKEMSAHHNWEQWTLQRPDQFHPKRKRIIIQDILNRYNVTKNEVQRELGVTVYSKRRVLNAIRRIVRNRAKANSQTE